MSIIVSRGEYEEELRILTELRGELESRRSEYEKKWDNLRRIVANIRYNQRRLAELSSRLEELRRIGWARLTRTERAEYLRLRDVLIPETRSRIAYWTSERDRVIADIYLELPEIRRLEEAVRAEAVHIRRKIVAEFIGDEGCTGMDIFYNPTTRRYLIRHPQTKELVRVEDKICIELTASIETHTGHDVPLIVEITATTYVKEMDLAHLISTEKAIENRLRVWLIEQNWGNVIHAYEKTGISYHGQKHVETKLWYTWIVPDYPKVHVFVEKKEPRRRSYEGDFTV